MKKIVIAFCAALAVFACSKEQGSPLTEVKYPQSGIEPEQITFDLSAVVTKAVKADWENGDVVYVFFSGVNAPKYLKITYNDGVWTSVEMNGASTGSLGLNNNDTGTMRAIHLPFANDATVTADGGSFKFSTTNYPYYMTATLAYTVVDNKVSGTFDMAIPEGFVQFFVKDDTDIASLRDGDYTLATDAVYPVSINSISADVATVNETSGDAGDALRGYVFNTGNTSTQGHLFAGKLAELVTVTNLDITKTSVGSSTENGWWSDAFVSQAFPVSNNNRLHLQFNHTRQNEDTDLGHTWKIAVSNSNNHVESQFVLRADYGVQYPQNSWNFDRIDLDCNFGDRNDSYCPYGVVDWADSGKNTWFSTISGTTHVDIYQSGSKTVVNTASSNDGRVLYELVNKTTATDTYAFITPENSLVHNIKAYSTPEKSPILTFKDGEHDGYGYYFTLTNTSANNQYAFFKHLSSALTSHSAINLPAMSNLGVKWLQVGSGHGVIINGVKWATVNVGAANPWDFAMSSHVNFENRATGVPTGWSVPAITDFYNSLINGTTKYWTNIGGNNGYIIIDTDAPNNFIFLPAAGQGTSDSGFDVGRLGYYRTNAWAGEDIVFSANMFITRIYIADNEYSVRPIFSE